MELKREGGVKETVALVVLLQLLAGATAALPKCAGGRPVSLLFLGNSLFAENNLPNLAAQTLRAGGCKVTVEAQTPSSYTLAQHAADINNPGSATAKLLGLHSGGRRWDYVVLQDQSQVPGLFMSPYQRASTDGLRTLTAAATAAGAKVLLYNTAAYRSGDPSNGAVFPNYKAMQDMLDRGYAAYKAAASPGATIIPVGAVYRRVFSDGGSNPNSAAFSALYASDGKHPSPSGSYLGALMVAGAAGGGCVYGQAAPGGVVSKQQADYLQGAACRTAKG
ncbi:MAG: hypothetical protein J3K34DRAFT_203247 [Monoraphidium minutum]|nr:MAG: hypothetical protein J3K34DRAFT_203247 [Monoraphidium minutum]